MATRNLLHKNKLEGFKQFLDDKGIAYRQGKGCFQVIQVDIPGFGWQPLFEKLEAPEHYSVPNRMLSLVREYIRTYKSEYDQPIYKVGEIWFVKHKGASALSKEEVIDVTPKTVELRRMTVCAHSIRYFKYDVEFVEQTYRED